MAHSFTEMFMRALAYEASFPPLPLLRHSDWGALWQAREHLFIRARNAARQHGRSYRDFRVGAAIFLSSTRPNLLRSIGRAPQNIYTGANWKLGQEERNTCAEQEIVAQIRQQQHLFPTRKALALVIAGDPQNEPDAESGLLTPTLHPCRHCRKLLREVREITATTVIITIGLSSETMEIMTFKELLRLHNHRPTLP